MLTWLCVGTCAASQVPFDFADGLIWVKVKPVGAAQSLSFVFDTGAGSSVLDLATARKLGLTFSSRERVQRVGEGVPAYRVTGFAADLAGVPVDSDPLAIDLSETSALCSRRIDGLIGHDFFRDRIVQIDFKGRCIRILDFADPRGSCADMSLRVRNSALCVPVSMNGSRAKWTRLDTGCDGGLHWVNRLGPRESRSTVVLGQEEIPHVPTEIHRSEIFPAEAGLVGNAILSNYRVTIDAINGRLLLHRS